jgi:hypothetical protein
MTIKAAICSQGFFSRRDVVHLCFGLGLDFGEDVGLSLCNSGFALLEGELGLVPSLLGDLLLGFLRV